MLNLEKIKSEIKSKINNHLQETENDYIEILILTSIGLFIAYCLIWFWELIEWLTK